MINNKTIKKLDGLEQAAVADINKMMNFAQTCKTEVLEEGI